MSTEPPSREQIQPKIERGLAQLEEGDFVDGEEFMGALLSDIDERRAESTPPSPSPVSPR